MSCQRCRRVLDDADPTDDADGVCEAHPPTALETLRQALHARSIQSAQAASEESAAAPIRAAWIIS
jgi:hypothetical protein